MAVTWHKTNFLGVRYREHATRKHGIRPDRCFSIRYKVDGKDKEEVVGWASEKVSAEEAFKILSTIRDNIKKGTGPKSLAGMREENERQADAAEKEQRAKVKAEITFSDFWENEYFPAAETTKTKQTVDTEKGFYANWIFKAIGNIPLQKIDPAKVEALALHVQKAGKSAQTVRHILGIVSRVWNKAWARGFVQGENPVKRVKKPRQDNKRMRFLSQSEASHLLEALAVRSMDTRDEALLALFCGLRAGEIHALTWADVDMKNETIMIRDPKSKNNRHAFMTDEVRSMFERRYGGQVKSDLVFPAINGKARRWVSDTFSRTVDDLGLNNTGASTISGTGEQISAKISDARQRVVFHTLRHTFASWLVQSGTPLYTVAKLMGHNTLEMTQRYSHLAPNTLRKAALSLQGKLSSTDE